MTKKLQVFISSTYKDLREDRQAAVQAVLKAAHIPAGMELFTAGNMSQMETIKRWIDESDIYMLILGGRYGSVEPTTSLSYTELEYDYAREKGKPLFAVVISDAAIQARVKEYGSDVLELDKTNEYKLFRAKVLTNLSSFFDDHKDIRLAVHETLSDFLVRYSFSGWVRGDEVKDTAPLLDEISRIAGRNAELEATVLQLRQDLKSVTNETPSDAFEKLLELLHETRITSKVFSDTGQEQEFSLADYFISMADRLVAGVTNDIGATERDSFLYYNVCTKLQVHGLVRNEKVAGVQWRRYAITPKGEQLLAYWAQRQARLAKSTVGSTSQVPAAKQIEAGVAGDIPAQLPP